ncbi:MAG: YdeI/OmpD-associated family protein [Fluviicola sp.]|nr:YdeI/OmpD-associated family protein [Fluviicola sp.]
MEIKNGIACFYASSRENWRLWLTENHQTVSSVWLIIYRKESGVESVYYPEAVDEALCFGWVDSKPNKRDEQSYYQFFSKRNPKSNWSKVNKDKVAKLIEQGLMQQAGIEMVELAKKSGTWTALDEVEQTIVPTDLKHLFDKNELAWKNWQAFSRSSRRGILEWILNAKKPETRLKRLEETVSLAEKNIKANHPSQ